ncbi:MAG TPA: hypothetical protein VFP68_23390 [Burkholderiaceae bacterium]|nr:hypothetical protein [Burkholderiaceae bacterium]
MIFTRAGRTARPASRPSISGAPGLGPLNLRFHRLMDSSPCTHEGNGQDAGLWLSRNIDPSIGPQAVFLRHLAVLDLLHNLRMLGEEAAVRFNPRMTRLYSENITHVYLSSVDFASASKANRSCIPGAIAYIDDSCDWFVIDIERALEGSEPKPTAAMIESLVCITEAPMLLAAQDRSLKDTARRIARHALGESGLALSEQAKITVKRYGSKNLLRWLLVGTPLPASALD